MKTPRTPEQKTAEREAARLERLVHKGELTRQSFAHHVPSRSVPAEIKAMAQLVDRFGNMSDPLNRIEPREVSRIRERMREARI
jgi:hypothetical protein